MSQINSKRIEVLLSKKGLSPDEENELLRECEPLIQGIINSMGWDDDRDILAQEGRIKILELSRNGKFDPTRARVFSFLYRSVKNTMLSYLAKETKQDGVLSSSLFTSPKLPDRLEEIGETEIDSDTIQKITDGYETKVIVGRLRRDFNLSRTNAQNQYVRGVCLIRRYLDRSNGKKMRNKGVFCRAVTGLLQGTHLEFLLEILTPEQLAEVFYLFAGLSIRFPSLSAIRKAIEGQEEKENSKT